ncbi:MAG: potassium-transporting ATPase subunit KdpC [Verrucomicrobiia bacterium]
MTKLFIQSIRLTAVFTVLTGLAYPLAITGVAQLAFRGKANGSLIERDGKIIGSELLAQRFHGAKYFWPRPSAGGYATVPSGASNLGPTSAALRSNVTANAAAIRAANKLPADARIPSDLLFASGSGLDPHISPDAARLQVARVAAARNVSEDSIKALVEKFIEPPQFGFLGESRVNVLLLNLALDQRK